MIRAIAYVFSAAYMAWMAAAFWHGLGFAQYTGDNWLTFGIMVVIVVLIIFINAENDRRG